MSWADAISDRDRVLAYLTGLVAVFVLAFLVGRLVLPYADQPPPRPSHAPTQRHS